MKRILINRTDGGISILTLTKENVDIESVLQKWKEAHGTYKSHRELNENDIPESREFRNAWTDVTESSKVDICCEKAKDVKLEELRVKRNKALEIEDKNFMIALEKGEDTSVISAKKQELRDWTNDLKSLDVTGKVNDEETLELIRILGEKE